jgi:L-alanine-DL-glutamate epimerase-like enolase superfamily enzyme
MRYDPNARWSFEEAIRFGRAIEDLRNDYFEDPVYGLAACAAARGFVRIPLATNTVVVNFEQLAANAAHPAIDVILLDTTFWGGIRPCIKAAGVCETLGSRRGGAQLGRARHPARDHAAPRGGAAQPHLRRRRPLPPPRPTT